MWAFDNWAAWLKSETLRLEGKGFACTFRDGRLVPELALNPSFSLEVATPSRLGRICFWRCGTCDYEVLDTCTGKFVADEAMLDANDESVPALVAQFILYFADQEH